MNLIKLNNIQAKKIAGRYDKGHALDPAFIEEDFFIIPINEDLSEVYGIAKRYLQKLLTAGDINIIDTAVSTDPDVIKWTAIKKETAEQSEVRITSRITKWDMAKEITREL